MGAICLGWKINTKDRNRKIAMAPRLLFKLIALRPKGPNRVVTKSGFTAAPIWAGAPSGILDSMLIKSLDRCDMWKGFKGSRDRRLQLTIRHTQ